MLRKYEENTKEAFAGEDQLLIKHLLCDKYWENVGNRI